MTEMFYQKQDENGLTNYRSRYFLMIKCISIAFFFQLGSLLFTYYDIEVKWLICWTTIS